MELTECSETSEHKNQTPGNHPNERIQQITTTRCAGAQFCINDVTFLFQGLLIEMSKEYRGNENEPQN
jgi:hypothetical protein